MSIEYEFVHLVKRSILTALFVVLGTTWTDFISLCIHSLVSEGDTLLTHSVYTCFITKYALMRTMDYVRSSRLHFNVLIVSIWNYRLWTVCLPVTWATYMPC